LMQDNARRQQGESRKCYRCLRDKPLPM
jgi:hypothetical protein